jgi:hypothetical protein
LAYANQREQARVCVNLRELAWLMPTNESERANVKKIIQNASAASVVSEATQASDSNERWQEMQKDKSHN